MIENQDPVPSKITLHKISKTLELEFASGERFVLPCEYLRVFSLSAETRDQPVVGKENVTILSIEPVGNYAVKFVFSDGHRTGIYSWKTLYELGVNKEKNWSK